MPQAFSMGQGSRLRTSLPSRLGEKTSAIVAFVRAKKGSQAISWGRYEGLVLGWVPSIVRKEVPLAQGHREHNEPWCLLSDPLFQSHQIHSQA
jgi:hypothetical protein